MAAPAATFYPVGLQHVRIYALNSLGLPDATSPSAPYEGLEIVGPKNLEITPARARDVVHTGNDRILSRDKLPSLEVSQAMLRTSRLDFAVNALLTGTNQVSLGESVFTAFKTDKQGSEPVIALLAFQKGKVAGTGTRAYGAYHMPSVTAIVDPASMVAEEPEYSYDLAPSPANHYIFGLEFTENVEGFTEAELVWSLTFGRPHIVGWKADGVVSAFAFHADRPAADVGKIHKVI